MAAYHTICTSCTIHSVKAREVLKEAMAKIPAETSVNSPIKEQSEEVPEQVPVEHGGGETTEDEMEQTVRPSKGIVPTANFPKRACAMCVKEPALPDPEDEREDDLADGVGRIRLRERKAMERQLAKEAKEAKAKRRAASNTNDHVADEQDQDDDNSNRGNDSEDISENDDDDEEDDDQCNDPFLLAVGGADKLLTGQAYQQKLLEKLQQQQQQQQIEEESSP